MAKVFGVIYGAGAIAGFVMHEPLAGLALAAYAAYLLVGRGRKFIIY